MFQWFTKRRRAAIRQRPFPDEWHEIIARNVPFVARLPRAAREELAGHIQIFLAEKQFEGSGGLKITDEIRVTIAAQACILLLHRPTDYFAKLVSIIVYPSTYVVPGGRHIGGGLIAEDPETRLGESWMSGVVVLVWDSVLAGARDVHDAQNVVLHEFAHQLDQESGAGDGAPILAQRSMYVAWARVLGREFDELVRRTHSNHTDLIDAYGAINPAEFFAVVTETFFEKPRQLRAKHPALYDELKQFYSQDPERYFEAP